MKVYDMKRGSGKTTYLIYLSNLLNIPILCHSSMHAEAIIGLAERIGIDIPKPIYVGKSRGIKPDAILIDELELVLKSLLNKEGLDSRVVAATYTSNPRDISHLNEDMKGKYINKAYKEIKKITSSERCGQNYDELISLFNQICSIVNNTENEIKELT